MWHLGRSGPSSGLLTPEYCSNTAGTPGCAGTLWSIPYGLFSTVHAYTSSQSLADPPMRDRRDSWAAAEKSIPSSSGAVRAPMPLERPPDRWQGVPRPDSHRRHRRAESDHRAPGVGRRDQQRLPHGGGGRTAHRRDGGAGRRWASSRILGDPQSARGDLPLTRMQEGMLLSVAAWYDNAMGYVIRLAETAARITR
jgi:glyceraldehyde 3-phosphate dehydrogenase